jgi:AcrR family transcriptional regulator
MPRAQPKTRPRDATATKQALLEAAQALFAERGFDRVGVRDIAEVVGVNPALVNRYFGSKEQLFAETVSERFDITPLLTRARFTFGETLVRYVLAEKDDQHRLNSVMALLVSVANDHAQTHLRQQLQQHFIAPLGAWLGGKNAELRASLIASELLGLVMLRDVARVTSLHDADLETLIGLVAKSIQSKVSSRT